MLHRFLHNKTAVGTVSLVLIVALMGIFAPVIAPHDPYATDILNKFAHFSKEYPLGTDNLGRCILSRMVYGIRPTLGLAVLTMLGTIGLGALMGLLAGYFRGITEELIMRVVDVMLSFPSQIMVFAVVALLGINVQNVILANVFIKWAWYARMIRTGEEVRLSTPDNTASGRSNPRISFSQPWIPSSSALDSSAGKIFLTLANVYCPLMQGSTSPSVVVGIF